MNIPAGVIAVTLGKIKEEIISINKSKSEISNRTKNIFDSCVENAIDLIVEDRDDDIFSKIKRKYENYLLVDEVFKDKNIVDFLKNENNKIKIKNIARSFIIHEQNYFDENTDFIELKEDFAIRTMEDVRCFELIINLIVSYIQNYTAAEKNPILLLQEFSRISRNIPAITNESMPEIFDGIKIKYEIIDFQIPLQPYFQVKFCPDDELIKNIVDRLNVDLPCAIKVDIIESDYYKEFMDEKLKIKNSDGFNWFSVKEKNGIEIINRIESIEFVVNNYIKNVRANFVGNFNKLIRIGFDAIGSMPNLPLGGHSDKCRINLFRRGDEYYFKTYVPSNAIDVLNLSRPVDQMHNRYLHDFNDEVIASNIIVAHLYNLNINKHGMHEFFIHDFIWNDS